MVGLRREPRTRGGRELSPLILSERVSASPHEDARRVESQLEVRDEVLVQLGTDSLEGLLEGQIGGERPRHVLLPMPRPAARNSRIRAMELVNCALRRSYQPRVNRQVTEGKPRVNALRLLQAEIADCTSALHAACQARVRQALPQAEIRRLYVARVGRTVGRAQSEPRRSSRPHSTPPASVAASCSSVLNP